MVGRDWRGDEEVVEDLDGKEDEEGVPAIVDARENERGEITAY